MLSWLSCAVTAQLLCVTVVSGASHLPEKEAPLHATLELRVQKVMRPSKIAVAITNRSRSPVKLWREVNSWGAARWRVMRIRNGEVTLFFQAPVDTFTRNVPGFDELPSQSSMEKVLDLSSKEWKGGSPGDVALESGDVVVAVYDVPWTDEARQLDVWCGAMAALAPPRQ